LWYTPTRRFEEERMTEKRTSAAFLAAILLLCAAPAAFSDNMYSSLDGFTITLDNPAYSIEVINEESGGRETAFEIVTPAGDTVYAFLYYRDSLVTADMKGYIIQETRELYSEEISEEQDEYISIFFDTLFSGQYAYRTFLTLGNLEYSLLGVDMRDSPGEAYMMLFAFPPFFELPSEEQDEILTDIFVDLWIDFMEAAG
jgi:hypothetical protein